MAISGRSSPGWRSACRACAAMALAFASTSLSAFSSVRTSTISVRTCWRAAVIATGTVTGTTGLSDGISGRDATGVVGVAVGIVGAAGVVGAAGLLALTVAVGFGGTADL